MLFIYFIENAKMYGPELSLYNAISKISEKFDETSNHCEGGNCDEGQCVDNIYCNLSCYFIYSFCYPF